MCPYARAALRFDLSHIPSDTKINSAKLELYATRFFGGSQTGDYSLFKISRSWVEGEADWNNASTGQKWSKPGGDYSTKAIDKAIIPRSEGKRWIPYDVVEVIQDFVKNSKNNYGIMIVNTKKTQEVDFVSSEGDTEFRPKLTIIYEVPTTSVQRTVSSEPSLKDIIVRSGQNSLYFQENNLSSPITITIVRSDGKCVLSQYVTSGKQQILSGLGAGVYYIIGRQNSRNIYFPSVIVP